MNPGVFVAQVAASSAVGGVAGELASPTTRMFAQLANDGKPNLVPQPEVVLAAYRSGFISRKEKDKLLRLQGAIGTGANPSTIPPDTDYWNLLGKAWNAVEQLGYSIPTVGEIRELINRGLIDEQRAKYYLEIHGFSRTLVQDEIIKLREQLPGASDLVRFAVREVWNDEVAKRFGYDLEYPKPFDAWMKTLGYVGNPRNNPFVSFSGGVDSWPKAYWRAHWESISPTQAYVAFQRLRPRDESTGRPRNPRGISFSKDDLSTILKIHDYPPAFREVLSEISYHVLNRVDIRRAYALGILVPAQVKEHYRDLGYDEREADILTRIVVDTPIKRKNQKRQDVARSTVCSLYTTGVLDRAKAASLLYRASIVDLDKLKEYNDRPEADQMLEAIAHNETTEFLDYCDLKAEQDIVKAMLRAVKKRYMLGDLSDSDLKAELIKIGLNNQSMERYLRLWPMVRAVEQKYSATATAQTHCKKGFITRDQLKSRLTNLGWTQDEIRRIAGNTACKSDGSVGDFIGPPDEREAGPAVGPQE